MLNCQPCYFGTNARITTLDPKLSEASNVVIKDNRFICIDDADKHPVGPETLVIDLKSRRVIPGLNDSYLHLIRGGLNMNLAGTLIAELNARTAKMDKMVG